MTDRFESILDECISALQAGVPVDEVLAEVPEYAEELRPLLYAATVLADPDPELAPEATKSALRDEYLKQVAELPSLSSPPFGEKMRAVVRVIKKRLTRKAVVKDVVTIMITIILTVTMALLILNYLALDTIPGDWLYGVKQSSENIQLALTFDESRRNELETRFNQRRLQEIERLIELNRVAPVQFRGVLETKGETLWVIGGYTIFLGPNVEQRQIIQEGDTVEVNGQLGTNHIVVADWVDKVE